MKTATYKWMLVESILVRTLEKVVNKYFYRALLSIQFLSFYQDAKGAYFLKECVMADCVKCLRQVC